MFTAASAFALFFILALAAITHYVAAKIKQPYTVMLVVTGILLAVATHAGPLHFLREFQLTPELLFYIFLPTLLFESAFNMNIRRLVDDWKPIMLLAVGALLISAFAIGGALWLVLQLLGLSVPFMVTLLFGALISATDPVAVLALFKEYGAPRRLTLIFEGESIANDATALALFLVVLGLLGQSVSLASVGMGGAIFLTMLFGGAAIGLLIGAVFIAFIGLFRENEIVATTLMIVLAHLTFLITELTNEWMRHAGLTALQFSPIIATTVASLLLGNYGRFKITPHAEEFVEKFWAQFAFMANSIVFILVGFLAASLPMEARSLLLPAIATIFVVAAARAISIYGTLLPFNFFAQPGDRIPLAWQHLLSWGSLRGALAVMLVLLVPENATVPGWTLDVPLRDFLLVLTVTCVFATLFIKATTIGPFMRRLKVDTLTPLEQAAEFVAKAIIHATSVVKLKNFAAKGYVPEDVAERMTVQHAQAFTQSFTALSPDTNSPYSLQTLRLYLLGHEKQTLKDLFAYHEIPERVFKRIYSKLTLQSEAIEQGQEPDTHRQRDKRDIFDNTVEWIHSLFVRGVHKHHAEEQLLYYRAQSVLSRKVLKELTFFEQEFETPVFSTQALHTARQEYTVYRTEANDKVTTLRAKYAEVARELDERLARRGVLRVEKKYLDRLFSRGLLTPKLFIKLDDQYKAEAEAETERA